jgi:hypothetical protein
VQVQVLFPALLQHKDLRQIGVSPFSLGFRQFRGKSGAVLLGRPHFAELSNSDLCYLLPYLISVRSVVDRQWLAHYGGIKLCKLESP